MGQHDQGPHLRVRPIAICLVAASCAVIVEGEARALHTMRDWLSPRPPYPSKAEIRSYEMWDSQHPGNYLLRPGASLSWRQARDEVEGAGAVLGVSNLDRARARYGIKEYGLILRINSRGYKGVEIGETHSRFRILAIGDSCTSGSLVDRYTYSRVLERELCEHGIGVEVVNAAVEVTCSPKTGPCRMSLPPPGREKRCVAISTASSRSSAS